jgi:hypothetical protein
MRGLSTYVDDMAISELSQMSRAADTDDPAVGLRAVVALRRLADQLEQRHVASARRLGWSWEEIGDALGVSRQAAHKKHGR